MKKVLLVLLLVLFPVLGQAQPRVYTVKPGDTLWKIASKEYQNSWLWPRIYRANPGLKNPDKIFPGQKLNIPEIPKTDEGLTLVKVDEEIRRVEARQAGNFTFLALKLSALSNRVDDIEAKINQPYSPQVQTRTPLKSQTKSRQNNQKKKMSGKVWLDGAWCLSESPNGYGAREIGAGIQIGRFFAYSGTPTLIGVAVSGMILPGLKENGFELSLVPQLGFSSIRLNVGRDIKKETALISNAIPVGALGVNLSITTSLVSGYMLWYGIANDIKGYKFWNPKIVKAGQGGMNLMLRRKISLLGQAFVSEKHLPEWQILAMVPLGEYRIGVGYGRQNPYNENKSRGMLVTKIEYKF